MDINLKETNKICFISFGRIYKLDKHFLIFSDDEMNIGDPVAGSQSLVSSSNNVLVTTPATTTTAASGLGLAAVSPLVSVPVAIPAKDPVAGPSNVYTPSSFYSTQQRSHVPEKGKKGKEPVAFAAQTGHFLSYSDTGVGNPLPDFTPPTFTPIREPGVHIEGPHLRNTMVKALDFFQLFFTGELVGSIVQHTNTCACIQLADENNKHQSYAESYGSGRILPLMKFLGLLPF